MAETVGTRAYKEDGMNRARCVSEVVLKKETGRTMTSVAELFGDNIFHVLFLFLSAAQNFSHHVNW